MAKKLISYKKLFTNGNLAGLSVDSGFITPADAVLPVLEALHGYTTEHPGRDAGTGCEFIATNIEVTEARYA